MEPVLAQLEEEYRGRVDFADCNVWDEMEKVSMYDISVTPTVVFLDANGGEVARLTGFQPKDRVRARIEELLSE